jgi:surface antigen
MIANLASLPRISFKKEISVVLIAMSVLLFMPMVAVMGMTDLGGLDDNDGASLYTGNASTTNTYIYGYCTFWAAERRIAVGKPIPNNWGDAHDWDSGARAAKYVVDHTPTKYAIMQTDAGALGHVAFVEEVGPDGSWKISEMNAKGWNILSDRQFMPWQAKDYTFIH